MQTLLRTKHKVFGETVWIEVQGDEKNVHNIKIDTNKGSIARKKEISPFNKLGKLASKQLKDYFKDASAISLPLKKHEQGTNQTAAMNFLQKIPVGETRTYMQQAASVRKKTKTKFGPRNAGTANRNNHYPLAIPCHRIVRSDGSLGGFMGSTAKDAYSLKRALIEHELKHKKVVK